MSELSKLTHPERVFLAGAIKATILGDGAIEESELEDFEAIYRNLDFTDYEDDLAEFERTVPDEAAFFQAARKIESPTARDLILKTVYDLMLQNGEPADAVEGIFMRLNAIWTK
jgi:hypothetical protein